MPEDILSVLGTLVVSAFGGGVALLGNYLVTRYQETNKPRLATLERRLEALQQAYAHWFRLRHIANPDTDGDAIADAALEWWCNNCLYLPPDVVDAFYSTVIPAIQHPDKEGDEQNIFWDELRALGIQIEKSVQRLGIHLPADAVRLE